MSLTHESRPFSTRVIQPGETPPVIAPKRVKMVAMKERWAREGRGLTSEAASAGAQRRRLPPGQHLVKDWPVLDLGHQPAVDHRDWSLRVGGAVERPFTWDWPAFDEQPVVETVADIHCVTAWSRYDNRWRGVPFSAVLAAARPRADARFVMLKSYDGYATNLPLSALLKADALLATHWEGAPLTRAHGGPMRLVLPHLYFWKSAKWLRQIWFMDRDTPGFWEARGYHRLGDPWAEQRYGPVEP